MARILASYRPGRMFLRFRQTIALQAMQRVCLSLRLPGGLEGLQGGGLGRSIPEGFTARQAKSAGSRADAAAEGAYLSYGRFRENLTRGRSGRAKGTASPHIAADRRKAPRT